MRKGFSPAGWGRHIGRGRLLATVEDQTSEELAVETKFMMRCY
jgi:hypothetical protein